MADPVSIPAILYTGLATAAATVLGGRFAKWGGKAQAGADISKTVAEAAQAAVSGVTEAMDSLREEVKRIAAAHDACEAGRKKDRAECAAEVAALRRELNLPKLMAEPVPTYGAEDAKRAEEVGRAAQARKREREQ